MSQRAVYKTISAELLDRIHEDPATFPTAVGRLDGAGSLVGLAQDLQDAGDLPPDSVDYFNDLIATKGPDTLERILRFGYLEAFELANRKTQPIETFWVTAPGDDFELHICEGDKSIVVFFFVPGEEGRDYGSLQAKSKSWVVRAGDRADVRADAPRKRLDGSILKIQVSGPPEQLD